FETTIHRGPRSGVAAFGACAPVATAPTRSSAALRRAARDVMRFMRAERRNSRAQPRWRRRSLERMMRLHAAVRRRSSWPGGAAAALMLAASALVPAIVAHAQPATVSAPWTTHVLRVCADPNNLPYSNEQRQGFENR